LRDGAELYYETQGSGPPLFLVPGLGGDGRFWDANARELARQFTVVVHDHRGTARSTLSKIKYTVEQMADDALQLIDELGFAKVHWCGHSTGGAMGQVLAISQPDRIDRLVLSATWAKTDAFFRRLFEVRAQVLPPPKPARTRPFPSPRSCCRASPPSWRMTGASNCRRSGRRRWRSAPATTW
jgi:aminoacrylate hydrolase